MQASQDIITLLNRLWHHISRRRRRQFIILLILMIFSSFAEVLSLGAVLPFLAVLTAPSRIFDHPAAQPLIQGLNLTSADQLLLPLTIAFGVATLIAGASRLLLLWASTHLSFATGADLSMDIYRRTLFQAYAVHVARNSSEVVSGIAAKTGSVITGFLVPLSSLISSSVILVAITAALLAINPFIALAAFFGFGTIYVFIVTLTRRKLAANSRHIAREATQVIKILQEGLGGIRDILIDGSQGIFCKIYRDADLSLRRAQGNNTFISGSPKYGVEALGMLLIAVLAYLLARESSDVNKVIPVLGALAIGAQRLLPVLQQGYSGWSTIKGSQASVQDALNLLDQPLPDFADEPACRPIGYKQNISLTNLSFRYASDSPWILRNLDLTIPKGARIGFIGVTGSGKSTLIDIIMGLLRPTEGVMAIDDQIITSSNFRAWQAHIAHVPQSIYLADNTIEENIAFGLPRDTIDHQRVRQAATQAQIAELIESWPKQYETVVGERGVRLSGGQRQRIGIARALYKRADVIVFDEATSALDNDTERAVMGAIDGLGQHLTILTIAHRLTTLQKSTQIIELGNGGVLRTGTYKDFVGDPPLTN